MLARLMGVGRDTVVRNLDEFFDGLVDNAEGSGVEINHFEIEHAMQRIQHLL